MQDVILRTIIETKQAEESAEKVNKAVTKTDDATKDLTGALDKMTNGAVTFFKEFVAGARRGVASMKTLKGAIAATGIGALVIAVGTLISYFTSTQRGADKLNQIFAAVGATIDVLIDRISTFGEGLYEIIFNGNFDKGLDILAGSFSGVVDEIINESNAALQLEKDLQALEKRKIEFIVTEEKMRAEIEAARLESEDFNKSIAERNAANEKAITLEKKLGDERAAIAREDLRIKTEQNALGETLNDDLREQKELEAQLFTIEKERDTRLKELIAKRRTLNDELAKSNSETRTAIELEALQPRGARDLSIDQDPEVTREAMLQKKLLEQQEQFEKDRIGLEIEGSILRRQEAERLAEAKIEAEQGYYAAASQVLGASLQLFARNEAAQKKIAAAEALFNTYLAINKTLAAFSGAPIPGYAIAQAIATGVFGLAQVKNILSTKPSGAGAGSLSSGGSSSAPTQTQERRVPDFSFANLGVGGQQNADFGPRESYVVEQTIRDKQALAERINDQARVA